jgi:hypothetical protein
VPKSQSELENMSEAEQERRAYNNNAYNNGNTQVLNTSTPPLLPLLPLLSSTTIDYHY